MAITRAQFKLNKEIKQAVHSCNEYEDILTTIQFFYKKIATLNERLSKVEKILDNFIAQGGTIKNESTGDGHRMAVISMGNLTYTIVYEVNGSVKRYKVENPGEIESTEYAHLVFFCAWVRPYYHSLIKTLSEQIANIDNDNTLRGICELRRSIRGDRFMTMTAVSGVSIQREEDMDPYGIFDKADDEE